MISAKFLPITLFLSLFIYLTSCQSNSEKPTKNSEIAELITRSPGIQNGTEWDLVQRQYVKLRDNSLASKKDYESQLKLAELFINEARITGEHGHYYPAALKITNTILESEDISKDIKVRALNTKAGVELSLHEFQTALETASEAHSLNPFNSHNLGVMIDAHVELGKYEEAVSYADQLINLKPELKSYARISYLRQIHGDNQGAIEAMKLAVQAGLPGTEARAWAMLTLGEMYHENDDLETAENVFNAILAERPNYPFAIGALANLEADKGNEEEAESLYKEAMSIIPEVGFYIDCATLYKKQGRTEEMNAMLQEILPMLEDDVIHGHNMNLEYADLYLELMDNPDKALEYAQIEFDKRPENIDVNQLLAKIYLVKSNPQLAQKHFDYALITNASNEELDQIKAQLQ